VIVSEIRKLQIDRPVILTAHFWLVNNLPLKLFRDYTRSYLYFYANELHKLLCYPLVSFIGYC